MIEPDTRPDAVMKMAKIGFREYTDYGDKYDEMGKYFGFSTSLDEHIGQFSLRLQPPNTYTVSSIPPSELPTEANPVHTASSQQKNSSSVTSGESVSINRSTLNKEQDEKDLLELDVEGAVKFVTERRNFRNEEMVKIINTFGE